MDKHITHYTKDLRVILIAAVMLCGYATATAQVRVHGNVYGGGNLADVKTNTEVNISAGTVEGNVYGGGNLGSVGTYTTSADMKTFTFTANTGTCNVTIDNGSIGTGVSMSQDGTFANGNVYGAGKGEADTYWCEKAMVYKTNVTINGGTVNGTVYGGGQIGRVENDATVIIGVETPTNSTPAPIIAGNVFGAGAGKKTHGYSALMRGDAKLTIQGNARVGLNVYGGGEEASVGRFKIVEGRPSEPDNDGSGDCIVNVRGGAVIGTNTDDNITDKGNVFGTCKGVAAPATFTAYDKEYKSMQAVVQKAPVGYSGTAWEYVEGSTDYYWEYYPTLDAYQGLLNTLALASHPVVTIGGALSNETTGAVTPSGNPTVNGSVYGGGQRGITLGTVAVNITGGTVEQDVYGGGALADTNKGNTTAEKYDVTTVTVDETVVTGMYERTGDAEPYVYTLIEEPNTKAASGKTYYTKAAQSTINTTTVDLTGGLIKGDAYGGGLGQKTGFNDAQGISATKDIPAVVWGDINVTLDGTKFDITYDTTTDPETDNEGNIVEDEGGNTVYVKVVKTGRVFGCNNLLGSPQGNVTVTVERTVQGNTPRTTGTVEEEVDGVVQTIDKKNSVNPANHSYELAAVYGGGNLAPYTATGKKAHVIINGCDNTSILTVYGGGNAAPVPETDVDVFGCFEIGSVFGGGNGKDKYTADGGTTWVTNPGADVNGPANTIIYGGTVHEAYGASNEKGTIHGNVVIDVSSDLPDGVASCPLDVAKLVGAGKNADVNGDLILIMGCKPDVQIPLVYGGADNANVNGDVELTITSGWFGKVFGGNNENGCIMGHIRLNIEETGTCGTPIKIEELYLGGNLASYSQYGYYLYSTNPVTGKPILKPRTAAMAAITDPEAEGYTPAITTAQYGAEIRKTAPYDAPELNIISCTYIREVFGGGLGETAIIYGNPTVNINMEPGALARQIDRDGDGIADNNPNALGDIGNVYGGGNEAAVYGNTTVNICTETEVQMTSVKDNNGVLLATQPKHTVTGAYITNSVYGGGCNADVLGNTNVTMSGGYVFNGIFGGGYAGSVGTFTRSTDAEYTSVYGHRAHADCIGKPISCATGTGKCTVVVSGGQIGPVEVATQGMNRKTNGHGDPVPQGWVWGGGCGIVEDPSADPDTHFKTYVNNTDVTIKGNAFILESIIGGGEFGRVLGNTLVKIEGGQIGVGENKVTDGKPVAYTEAQWTEAEEAVKAGSASRINAIAEQMPACSHFPYGRNDGTNWVYDTYDPYADEWKTAHSSDKYPGGSTDNASDGKTWIGCVFAGGSGYMPFVNRNSSDENSSDEITDYNWVPSAGWVEGNAEVRITGGHILTNVYGGNEYTDVKGKCTVKMSGGSVGVPLSLSNKRNNPMTGNIYGAGKGDPRVNFNKVTNVKDVEVEITGGIVYGSVYGGGEDGHVLRDVTITIGKQTTTEGVTTSSGPTIGTWGTTYVDGNIFGGGRGFSGEAYTAGNVAGSVKLEIKGGQILGSVYGGGRMASVGYGLFDAITNGQTTPGYGEMRADSDTETGFNSEGFFTKGRGHIDITISGGTIGNSYEYIYNPSDALKSSTMPLTEFDSDNRLKHTKGGNVFAGGMGNLYEQNGTTFIHIVDWWRLGCVKSTKLTITGGTIKSCIYGGGELGQVVGYHTTKNAADQDINVGTEVIINGGTIGTEVTENDVTQYTFGSVFGGGYGSLVEVVEGSYPKYIAGRVKAGTKVNMTAGSVLASVYGGGEMAAVGESKTLGETLTTGHSGDTYVSVSGGTVGIAPITISGSNRRYFGGAKMGNVYGGGSGHGNTVRSGHVYGNTNVTISAGSVSGEPRIYHNIYGGGAYGSVGDFTYQTDTDAQTGTQKVFGVEGLNTAHTNSGVARVTITGGTIGYDGKENGMVCGSSRGDINSPGKRDDHTAWTYDTHVTIGTAATGTYGQEGYVAATGPSIKGSIYGSGENGHVFNNAVVTVNGGTIGIVDTNDDGYTVISNGNTYSGAEYPYRGNVYGGGCGTDKYYSGDIPSGHTYNDGGGESFNPLAGIVYGNATVNITGGTVVSNVYGAGAMGSVGKATTTEGVTTVSGGTTTINVSGGTIGDDGTRGDGNVFGAARGDASATINEFALVRKETNVNITGGTIKGNVYGGGELGCVGTFTVSSDMRTFTWQNTDGDTNASGNAKNTGVCNVTIDDSSGSSPLIEGNVFGAGKGKDDSFWCEKGIAYSTSVSISNGTVNGNVFGGGEVGRVETNTEVTIGDGAGTSGGASAPTITRSVFGGGAGVETHGYSALVRGNTKVTVKGNAGIGHSVYGGGEIASVGKYGLDDQKMPSILQGGGYCYVTVQGYATITDDVFGAGQGVTPHFDMTNTDHSKRSRRMTVYNSADFPAEKEYPNEGYTWERYATGSQFVWDYLQSEDAYSTYLETLALATHPEVTIDGNATINGSVFGGGELGLTKGSVVVNIQGGTIAEDVYGGGSLANTNTTSTVDLGNGLTTFHPTTTVNLKGGIINRNVYGGGLGRLAKDAVAAQPAQGTEGEPGYVPAVAAQDAVTAVEAKVYGEVTVKLNETVATDNCVVKGMIFGCNNLNGSPQKNVTVHVYKTVGWPNDASHTRSASKNNTTYEVTAVYGGGNLAAYYPDLLTDRETAVANVIIDGCELTSIKTVYGGGNAASVPATEVTVNGTYEIGQVFGGGNGKDDVSYDGGITYVTNPGANVGYRTYPDAENLAYDTKENRIANYGYGIGKAHATILGGMVHEVYGGSNTRGNVRVESRTTLNDAADDDCTFNVGEAYGGGHNAPMDGDAVLEILCIPGLAKAYGGAADADVNGNVVLNITNGTYEQVFGGNDKGGAIRGTITVNINETGCHPIIIGELYGGGNEAAYSVYGYASDGTTLQAGDDGANSTPVRSPEVNVNSFTSIGTIFGGGYGAPATMVGDPTVNINVVKGKFREEVVGENARVVGSTVVYSGDAGYAVPSHTKGAIGAINTVYGGGNAAQVIGNTTVNIGTEAGNEVYEPVTATLVVGTTDVTGYFTRSGAGTVGDPYVYTAATGNNGKAEDGIVYYEKKIVAVDIRGNVFGGGNAAEVTGDTNVVIGRRDNP